MDIFAAFTSAANWIALKSAIIQVLLGIAGLFLAAIPVLRGRRKSSPDPDIQPTAIADILMPLAAQGVSPLPLAGQGRSSGWFDMLLNAGTPVKAPLPQQVAIRCTNLSLLSLILMALLWTILSLTFWPQIKMLHFANGFCLAGFYVCLLGQQRGWLDFARFGMLLFGVIYYVSVSLVVGPRLGVEIYLIIAALLPVLVFQRTERVKMLATYGLIVLTAIAVWQQQRMIGTVHFAMSWSDSTAIYAFYITIAFTAGITTLLLYFFKNAAIANYVDLEAQKRRSEALLHDILPEELIRRLQSGESSIVDSHGETTVLLAYITGISTYAHSISPIHMIEVIDRLFSDFDSILATHGVEKIKTFGNAYLGAVGQSKRILLPLPILPLLWSILLRRLRRILVLISM
jgi:Adenylate and Guanylate cyclase catalytic domain